MEYNEDGKVFTITQTCHIFHPVNSDPFGTRLGNPINHSPASHWSNSPFHPSLEVLLYATGLF